MQKIGENISTIFRAARYSLQFCWRNDKKDTVMVFILAVFKTAVTYLTIQSIGAIINAVQKNLTLGHVHITDLGLQDFIYGGIFWPVILLAIILFAEVVFSRLTWFYNSRAGQTLRFANMREINEQKASLDVASFRSKNFDDIKKRIEELPNSWGTRLFFSKEFMSFFTNIFSLITFGVSLFFINPLYALILLLTSIPLVVTELKFGNMWWATAQTMIPHHKVRYMLEKAYNGPIAFIQALIFDQMPHLRKKIDQNVNNIFRAFHDVRITTLKGEIVSYTLSILGLVAVVLMAIWSSLDGAIAIGSLTILISTARQFQKDIERVSTDVSDQWNNIKGVIMIEEEYFGLKPHLKTLSPVVPDFGHRAPRIRFENVSFIYPESQHKKEVLENISFSISPGSKVAIVGKSGSGKSTIMSLMMRHHDPTTGQIFVDDINLKNIDPRVWSRHISALLQDFVILERTIAEEIASSRMGNDLDRGAVSNIADLTDFSEVVKAHPSGLDAQIGLEHGGREFSGGEKQRLALARSLYPQAKVVILDEPDSRLDPESANKVIEGILSLKDVTVILITHHVSRAEKCDKVIVIGAGKILEQGTHSELIAKGASYAALFQKDKERLGGKGKVNEEN